APGPLEKTGPPGRRLAAAGPAHQGAAKRRRGLEPGEGHGERRLGDRPGALRAGPRGNQARRAGHRARTRLADQDATRRRLLADGFAADETRRRRGKKPDPNHLCRQRVGGPGAGAEPIRGGFRGCNTKSWTRPTGGRRGTGRPTYSPGGGLPFFGRARSAAGRVSQTRTVKSPEPETSRVPSGLKATAWTYDSCPRSSATSSPAATSHRRMVLSSQPAASRTQSGLKATP